MRQIDKQCSSILNYLRTHKGGITSRDAQALFRCDRLGARIFDLRSDGHVIDTELETRENEYGEKKRYARYFLIKEATK